MTGVDAKGMYLLVRSACVAKAHEQLQDIPHWRQLTNTIQLDLHSVCTKRIISFCASDWTHELEAKKYSHTSDPETINRENREREKRPALVIAP